MVMDPLARKVLEGSVAPGDSITAGWDAASNAVTFDRQAVAESSAPAAAQNR
jgi:hypothetical protein